MIRVHVFVEGQTEETFLNRLLYPYFIQMSIFLNAILVRTSSMGKGGVVSYAKIKPQINNKCLEDKSAFVSTMFDLFRLPPDFPGRNDAGKISDPLQRACVLEKHMAQNIQYSNFLPNLLVHEFEGLLYSEPGKFSQWFDDKTVDVLRTERTSYPSPEYINDGPETAPSKRILRVCSNYEKPLHGTNIALAIGLDRIRSECHHFDEWLRRLSALSLNK